MLLDSGAFVYELTNEKRVLLNGATGQITCGDIKYYHIR
jgi:hypothetical protein